MLSALPKGFVFGVVDEESWVVADLREWMAATEPYLQGNHGHRFVEATLRGISVYADIDRKVYVSDDKDRPTITLNVESVDLPAGHRWMLVDMDNGGAEYEIATIAELAQLREDDRWQRLMNLRQAKALMAVVDAMEETKP